MRRRSPVRFRLRPFVTRLVVVSSILCAGEYRHAELFPESEVVAVIPDLHDFSLVAEPEDVDAGKGHPFARWSYVAPGTGVRTRRGPASCDEIAVPEDEIDLPVEVRKRATELLCDRRLSSRPWCGLRRSKVVTDVVVGEHLLG